MDGKAWKKAPPLSSPKLGELLGASYIGQVRRFFFDGFPRD